MITWAIVGPCTSVMMCDNAGVEERRDARASETML